MSIQRVVILAFIISIAILLIQAERWLIYAVLASAIVGLMIAGDAFLFEEDVYENWMEPLVISGALGLAPWVVAPFVITAIPDYDILIRAILAGVMYMIGFVFYFKAMYLDQDAVVITVMWSLGIAIVPLLAYFTLGEHCSILQYIGIVSLLVGTAFVSWKRTAARAVVVGFMTLAVFLVSISVVLLREVFTLLQSRGGEAFWSGYLTSTLGECLVAVIVLMMMNNSKKLRLCKIIKSYWPVFILMEGSQISANVISSLALSLGTASFVVAIDGLSGAFVIIFSMMAVEFTKNSRFGESFKRLESNFNSNLRRKIFGIAVVVIGAYLIG